MYKKKKKKYKQFKSHQILFQIFTIPWTKLAYLNKLFGIQTIKNSLATFTKINK